MIDFLRLYNRSIFKINLIASFVFALFMSPNLMSDYSIKTIIAAFLNGLILSLPTGGFLLAIFFYQISRKNEYYFFRFIFFHHNFAIFLTYIMIVFTLVSNVPILECENIRF